MFSRFPNRWMIIAGFAVVVVILGGMYVASQQKYKNPEYQAYKLKYSKCDPNGFTADSTAYKAWINNTPLPSC